MKKFKLYTHLYWNNYSWESINDSLYMEWDIRRCFYGDPYPPPGKDEKVFYTDTELAHAREHDCAEKIAWMLESRYICPQYYRYLEANIDVFDTVLTHDEGFNAKFPDKCVFYPHNNCTIKRADHKLYDKTKLVSFISSTKQMNVSGHRMRHAIYELYCERQQHWVGELLGDIEIDLYGALADNFVQYKLDSLRDYRFQIVVENSIIDTYFTEKIIDCFVTGTVPIYYGTRKVDEFFDADGIIHFATLEELFDIVGNLNDKQYQRRRPAIERNFELARNHLLPEDWLYENTRVFD